MFEMLSHTQQNRVASCNFSTPELVCGGLHEKEKFKIPFKHTCSYKSAIGNEHLERTSFIVYKNLVSPGLPSLTILNPDYPPQNYNILHKWGISLRLGTTGLLQSGGPALSMCCAMCKSVTLTGLGNIEYLDDTTETAILVLY